jgi:hypothetical protein
MHGVCGEFVPSRVSLSGWFTVSTHRWVLGIWSDLSKAAILSVVPELNGSAFTVALLGDGNDSFTALLRSIAVEKHYEVSVALYLSRVCKIGELR